MNMKNLTRTKIASVALIVFVPLGYFAFMTLFGESLGRKMDALRAAGEPLTVADLQVYEPESVPPEQNAALFLIRADDDLNAVRKDLSSVYGVKGFEEGRLDEAELCVIEAALQDYPDLVPLLMRAARCSGYYPQFDYGAAPQAFSVVAYDRWKIAFSAVYLLAAQAHWLLEEGQVEAALESSLAIFQLSRHFRHEPMPGSLGLRRVGVVIANRILRSGDLPDAAHDALEAELAGYDDVEDYRRWLRCRRVIDLEGYRTLTGGPMRLFRTQIQSELLDTIDRHLELAAEPYAAVAADYADYTEVPLPHSKLRPLSAGMHYQLMDLRNGRDRILALVRCLRILNALERRGEHCDVGSAPDLADLQLPPEVFIDPFNGETLQVKRTPDGWLIYSVGRNLQDDGGILTYHFHKDVGLGPATSSQWWWSF
jgi:hypothetical protein